MSRSKGVLVLVPVLVLAGCIGGLGAETGPSDSTDVSPDAVPGVTSGTLANASALAEANQDAVLADGAILRVNQSSDRRTIDARLEVGANDSTYTLSGTESASDGQSRTIDQWRNETARYLRTTSDGETNYRVLDTREDRLPIFATVGQFLSAGNFEVANETTGDGTIVLTADSVSAASQSMADATAFDGRLVVDESGRIQDLSVTVTRDGDTATYSYELQQTGVDSVPKPEWVDDVPPSADVQAQLSVDVVNGSYLALEHGGGDVVPDATTVSVASNGTADTVTLDSSLAAGDTRYLYVDASSQALRVSADRPAQSAVSPLTSPVSVEIVTEGGAVLHSGGMAWDSASASDEAADGSTGSASENGTGESAGSSGSAGSGN